MLLTWNEQEHRLSNCVDFAYYPTPKDGDELELTVCNRFAQIEKKVTFKVTKVTTASGTHFKLKETGMYAGFFHFFRFRTDMEVAVQDKLNADLANIPPDADRDHTRLNHFKRLEQYSVRGDGACFWHAFLAAFHRNKTWLDHGSSAQITQALQEANATQHILNAIHSSFINNINHTDGLPDYVKSYFAEHPDFAQIILDATINRRDFRLFVPSFVLGCLPDFPPARSVRDAHAIQRFILNFVDSIFYACQEGLQFHTNTDNIHRLVEKGEPVAMCNPQHNHYELLASPDYFQTGFTAEPLPATGRSQILMTKTCPESLLRCVLAFKLNDPAWTDVENKSRQEVAAEFEKHGFKQVLLSALASKLNRRVQNSKGDPTLRLPKYLRQNRLISNKMLEAIYQHLFLEDGRTTNHTWKLHRFLNYRYGLEKDAEVFEGGNAVTETLELAKIVKGAATDNETKIATVTHSIPKKTSGDSSNTDDEWLCIFNESFGINGITFPKTEDDETALYSILEEATQRFLERCHIPSGASEQCSQAYINGRNGHYYIYKPDN
ncbi:hypothetical protein [Parashewanella tropica]|uniref:hypothetical protein n=1 Tax=Parashewanella tropica TaxID=2547970 RepID=UPI00105927F5|nr:hypothetical protein [Parashewanella tropica]